MFFFYLPFCVSPEERGTVETVKSVLGLEETARQLLFLHSSKSSLESNLPVCYCIQTTPQPTSSVPPLSVLLRARVSFTVAAGPSTLSRREHTHTRTHIHIHIRDCVYTRAHTARHTKPCANSPSTFRPSTSLQNARILHARELPCFSVI